MRNQLIVILTVLLCCSCRKFIDPVPPANQLTGDVVFNDEHSAIGAMLSIYARMEAEGLIYHVLAYAGLSADEFSCESSNINAIELANNNLTAENEYLKRLWGNIYRYIYQANAVLEGVEHADMLSPATRRMLKGEALFVRSFCHYLLTGFFGSVPLITTTDYRVIAGQPRTPERDIYAHLSMDLTMGIELLSENYPATNGEQTRRSRPNKATLQLLLAKVHLQMSNWAQAHALTDSIIAQTDRYQLATDLDQVFLKTSEEAIWQLQSVTPGFNSYAGAFLIPTPLPSLVSVSPFLLERFDHADLRKRKWINSGTVNAHTFHFPYKYKVGQNAAAVTEYTTVFRLAEVYLIRAEARAMQGHLSDALADVNIIRARAALPAVTASTPGQFARLLEDERSKELFAELGDRWFFLKRKQLTGPVLQPVKGINWTAGTDELYPIPSSEILRNPALTQNNGY